jgi:hypothetical protein
MTSYAHRMSDGAEAREAYQRRLAEIQVEIDARNAAEAADTSLVWRRRGADAAQNAVFAQRYVPVEGREAFWAAFDEALREARMQD